MKRCATGLLPAAIILFAVDAYADGLDKVNTFLDNITAILHGAAIAAVTVAIMWAGYKLLFQHARPDEVMKIIIAGLLIGGAAEIANYLLT